ncbi:MAG: hypothetical protein ACRDIU_10110, partial [Actinomycetota bacterium]
HITLSTTVLEARPEAEIHMPHPSPWPVLLSLALTVLFFGVLIDSAALSAFGLAATVAGIGGWFWPRGETQET